MGFTGASKPTGDYIPLPLKFLQLSLPRQCQAAQSSLSSKSNWESQTHAGSLPNFLSLFRIGKACFSKHSVQIANGQAARDGELALN